MAATAAAAAMAHPSRSPCDVTTEAPAAGAPHRNAMTAAVTAKHTTSAVKRSTVTAPWTPDKRPFTRFHGRRRTRCRAPARSATAGGAGLYDRKNLIPFDRLDEFFAKSLA